jgi:hypothetical protein
VLFHAEENGRDQAQHDPAEREAAKRNLRGLCVLNGFSTAEIAECSVNMNLMDEKCANGTL